MRAVFVYITNPSRRTAKSIAKHLLEKRLIACANIFEIESFYWWDKKIENSKEYVLICKTIESRYAKIKREVAKMHPYSVPCIAKFGVELNDKFASWLKSELNYHADRGQ